MTTPGMKILCRDSFSQPKHAYDHPLSGRFDEQDAFVIFDDVEVPKDRVFIDANLAAYNAVMRTSWSPNIMQQTMIRAQTKLEFAWGIANRMLKCINGKQPAAQEMLGEIWTFSEFARSAIYAAEMQAQEYPGGVWFPDVRPLHALRATLPYWFPRVNEIIRLLGSHNVFAAPTLAQMRDPELKPLIDRYLRGAGDVSAEERVRVFRLGWDFVGSGLASRNEQYERFYLASGARNRQMHESVLRPRAGRPPGRPVPRSRNPETTAREAHHVRRPRERRRGGGFHRSLHRRPPGRLEGAFPRPVAGRRLGPRRSLGRRRGGSRDGGRTRRAGPFRPGRRLGRKAARRSCAASPRASWPAPPSWRRSRPSTTARCWPATSIASFRARRRTSPTSPSMR